MLSKTIKKIILAALLLATSLTAFSAALETGGFTFDPFPLNPTTSTPIFLHVSQITNGCSFVSANKVSIDSLNKQIEVLLSIDGLDFSAGCPPFPDPFSIPVGIPSNTGNYQVSVYELFYNEHHLVGTFNLLVSGPNQTIAPEVPAEGSIQSGVGMVRGWACDAKTIEVSFDGGELIPVAYGTSREDTRSICGDANNGYGMVIAWGLLGEGLHQMKTFKDGIEILDVEFTVSGLDEPFVKDLSGIYQLHDFPAPGESVTIEWSEPHQNFIIIDTH